MGIGTFIVGLRVQKGNSVVKSIQKLPWLVRLSAALAGAAQWIECQPVKQKQLHKEDTQFRVLRRTLQ